MLILAIDTATPTITSGIVRLLPSGDMHELAVRQTTNARAHAERLIPQVLECCEEIGQELADIDAVVVGCGPGPFTGLRVGMATAVGIADAAGIPAYGVGTLDAIAGAAFTVSLETNENHQCACGLTTGTGMNSAHEGDNDGTDQRRRLIVLTDARRREVYYAGYALPETEHVSDSEAGGAFRISDARPQQILEPSVGALANIDLHDFEVAAGDAEKCALTELPTINVAAPTPLSLVALAAADILGNVAPAPLIPFYLRRPDATVPRKRPVSSSLVGLEKVENARREFSSDGE